MHFFFRLEHRDLSLPKTVTCRVLSTDTLKTLSNSLIQKDDVEQLHFIRRGVAENSNEEFSKGVFACNCFPLKMLLIFTIIIHKESWMHNFPCNYFPWYKLVSLACLWVHAVGCFQRVLVVVRPARLLLVLLIFWSRMYIYIFTNIIRTTCPLTPLSFPVSHQ